MFLRWNLPLRVAWPYTCVYLSLLAHSDTWFTNFLCEFSKVIFKMNYKRSLKKEKSFCGKSWEFQTIFGEGQHPLLAAAGSHVSNCEHFWHLQADCYCGNRPCFVKMGWYVCIIMLRFTSFNTTTTIPCLHDFPHFKEVLQNILTLEHILPLELTTLRYNVRYELWLRVVT